MKIRRPIKAFVNCVLCAASFLFIGCSSGVKKASIASSANPQDEITKLQNDLAKAKNENVDVLAANDFHNSLKWLTEAKSDLSSNQDQEEILDDLRLSRGYLERAQQVAEIRVVKVPNLFEARRAAMDAGVDNYPELRSDLADLDRKVSNNADRFDRLSVDELATFQRGYLNLERRAIVLGQLGTAQAQINGARDDNAEKLAPVTYKRARLALRNAELAVSTSLNAPEGYKAAVANADQEARLLTEVMTVFKQSGTQVNEAAALRMVSQRRQIAALKANLKNSTTRTVEESEKNKALSRDLSTAQSSLQMQKAIEMARGQFTEEEAETFQQGNNLVIRLKTMNFPIGQSDLPPESLALLSKISNVAKEMNATELKVEGHTDSTGNRALNKEISEKRANAVASYFKTNGFDDVSAVGYGFQKPIASNRSKEGRAQNRRVDVVIMSDDTQSVSR